MVVLLVVAAGALVAIQWRRPKAADPFVGLPLAPMSAEGWLNTQHAPTPDALRGSVVLVDYWATDCPSCVREMPALAALHRRFRDHGLKVVGLAPESGEAAERVKRFVESEKIDWPIGYGAGFSFETMGIEFTPTYVLYDRAGRGVWGGHSLDGLEEKLLAELAR